MIMRLAFVVLLLNESITGLLEHKLQAINGAPNIQKKWMSALDHLLVLLNFLNAGYLHSGHRMISLYPFNRPLCK
jgi:hypothetical protein